ncbi:MAG: RnfABCDGE type electron transport complex subunit G [Hungatella sp.]|jgi:electron transport complex protein RnfG|nr:RnfABCDGE type electron transport complex subunit G [Hungatella sp.]
MSKGGFMKDALILFAITLAAGACLGGAYEITRGPIQAAELAAKEEAFRTVLADAASFQLDDYSAALEKANTDVGGLGFGNVQVDECATGVDGSGSPMGYVVTSTSKDGYGGNITISVGITADGQVKGVEFLTITETAGLGMNATTPEWKGQFADKTVESFSVTKSGASADNEIDAIGGATITSNAVAGAVNAALYLVNSCVQQ